LKNTIQILLLPFSILYGFILYIRNVFFNWDILPSKKFDFPIIAVGNLNLGGVGKTPHVEYLIRLLKEEYNVATLSRGYKRKTKGFFLAHNSSTVADIGDEPLQYFKKFKSIKVAVDEKLVHGIEQLKIKDPSIELILLDDAYQHRYVEPGINILATNYSNLYIDDYVVPSGRLREWPSGSKRATIIIVTKCPPTLTIKEREKIKNKLTLSNQQQLYFTYLKYGKLVPFTKKCNHIHFKLNDQYSILLVTAIANPSPLFDHLQKQFQKIDHISFSDHHNFSQKDIHQIESSFNKLNDNNKLIITTEKDIMRLSLPNILNEIQKLPIYYVPIEICFHNNDKKEFDSHILNYVKTNSRN